MAEGGTTWFGRFWAPRSSLTNRIMAVNVIALGLLAGSLFYIDSYRNQLLGQRFILASHEAQITAQALAPASNSRRRKLMAAIGAEQQLRLRYFSPNGKLIVDSFELDDPSFAFVTPDDLKWYERAGQSIDRITDTLIGAPEIEAYVEPEDKTAAAWPELKEARDGGAVVVRQRLAPDGTPVINAAIPVGEKGETLLTTRNARDVTQTIRDARQTLAIIVGTALAVSILLSLFLARTIIVPLRQLVRAAVRVRLGRDREVVVPRLPERRDEIGHLARAVSDMTAALRARIDAVESFAADVAHEIKNPLASLRSAIESLEKVEDPALREQLTAIAAFDVKRIDRLVTEISDASRIDAELSRTTFEPVDMHRLVSALVAERDSRSANAACEVIVTREGWGDSYVPGDPARLERVIENLLDNAVSFSPSEGRIEIEIRRADDRVLVSIRDEGPGIPEDTREKVFERFHSLRPAGEAFGGHSGLGLAIARTIVEAHDGALSAHGREDGQGGARLVIDLPAWGAG
ncbi:MAG: sensor N-terminal transmembrane domain-containing protein [Novosphingobium sp.]|nr:sensor N-terminal transmembrane domain-containing protein [Novosphingobium sp.]